MTLLATFDHLWESKWNPIRNYQTVSRKKGYSRKFGVASDPPSAAAGTPERHGGTIPRSKSPDQVAFVAPSRSKVLRRATTRLPEKTTPIGPGQSRTSPKRRSRKSAKASNALATASMGRSGELHPSPRLVCYLRYVTGRGISPFFPPTKERRKSMKCRVALLV